MADANSTPMRVCTSCGIEKPATADHFHAYKRAPDGCRSVCRLCRAADYAANREERLERKRQHYQENRDRITASVRSYYEANAEAQREAARKRYWRNRDRYVKRSREYHAAHRDRLNARKRERSREVFRAKYGSDDFFTLRHRMRALLRRSLNAPRGGKRLEQVLGYSLEELREHLERQFTKGMNWERFMKGEIHVDHIVPISAFNPTSIDSDEFRACWALANLRPVWAAENLSKGAKIQTLL